MIFIHRGKISKKTKENSLEGFKLSIAKGLNIETDIHFISDGSPVCYHDFSLLRINNLNRQIKSYNPDYVCFGPLSTEFNRSLELVKEFKKILPSIKSVFGGKHVLAIPEEIKKNQDIDYLVWGPVYETINKIIESPPNTFIKGAPTYPCNMQPALKEYFEQVPRMGNRERKYIMSHFGCVYNCSFCCTSVTRKSYGAKAYIN